MYFKHSNKCWQMELGDVSPENIRVEISYLPKLERQNVGSNSYEDLAVRVDLFPDKVRATKFFEFDQLPERLGDIGSFLFRCFSGARGFQGEQASSRVKEP